jgi:hypothetical protein
MKSHSRSTMDRAFTISDVCEIIGNMMLSCLPPAAEISARSCNRNRAGLSSAMRMARQPIAGLASLIAFR